MERISLDAIAERLGTTTPIHGDITEISTDTRNLPEGCLFLALRGAKFDGHSFVRNAIEAGAVAAVTDTQMGENPCIVVGDTGQALLDIASLYREQFDIPVVGITGSVGKTTTKEMTASVLSQRFKTLKTEANLNNEIGCPKTLLGLTKEHGAAVIEMGMNHFGEISRMSRCTKPTMAVITNIGFSHVENLGSQEGILKAKLEMLEGMNPHAPLIVSGDDKLLAPLRDSLEGRLVYTFSTEGNPADVSAEDIKGQECAGGVSCRHALRYGGAGDPLRHRGVPSDRQPPEYLREKRTDCHCRLLQRKPCFDGGGARRAGELPLRGQTCCGARRYAGAR